MGWRGPDDWPAIAAGHQKQPFADGGRAVIAGAQFPVKLAQSADESAVVADPLTTVAAHSHDHCILSALRRSPAHLQTESAPNAVLTALNLGERRDADQLIPPVIALLDLAPKSSPPAS